MNSAIRPQRLPGSRTQPQDSLPIQYHLPMSWNLGHAFDGAYSLLLALAAAALLGLFGLILKETPKSGSFLERARTGVSQARWQSVTFAGIVTVLILVVIFGWVTGARQAPNEQAGGEAATSTPSLSVSPTPTSLKQAGWGPARSLVSINSRPVAATLNSVVDHPLYGDERSFMRVRLADNDKSAYANSVTVEPGSVYEVLVAINNDAADGGEDAENVRLRLQIPGVARGSAPSYAFVTSSSTTPNKIWDGVTLVGEHIEDEFSLRYVSDSAVLHSGGKANGTVLADDVFTDGVLIGCDSLDGVLPAGDRCQSWVTFKVRIDQPNFEATALAQLDETDTWSETVVATSGQQVRIVVTYKNTGTTQQSDVVLRVSLPNNVHYLKGSSLWSNSSGHNIPASSDGIVGEGLNLGSYAPGASVYVELEVIVDGPSSNSSNVQELDNFFTVSTNNGDKHAPLTLIWL